MDHNATIPGLLNLSALRIANDNCVRVTIVPGFAPPRQPPKPVRDSGRKL
jgi:hypothetical protein